MFTYLMKKKKLLHRFSVFLFVGLDEGQKGAYILNIE